MNALKSVWNWYENLYKGKHIITQTVMGIALMFICAFVFSFIGLGKFAAVIIFVATAVAVGKDQLGDRNLEEK